MSTLYDIQTVAERLSISQWQVFALTKSGRLRSVKIGKRRLVTESALADYVTSLEAEADPGGVISA